MGVKVLTLKNRTKATDSRLQTNSGSPSIALLSKGGELTDRISRQLLEAGYGVVSCATGDELNDEIDVALLVMAEFVNPESFLNHVGNLLPELPVILISDAAGMHHVSDLLRDAVSRVDYLQFDRTLPELLRHVVTRNIKETRTRQRVKELGIQMRKVNRTVSQSLRELEADQQTGYRVQSALMPVSPQEIHGLTLKHRIQPSLILSGDFVDYFELADGRLLFFIADVSGHGSSGAMVTVLLKSLSSRLKNESDVMGLRSSSETLEWFNEELLLLGLEQHVAMFLGLIDEEGSRMQYANAGHFPSGILTGPNLVPGFLASGGLPLGLRTGSSYEDHRVNLPDRFLLTMFSDGVFELMTEMKLSDKERELLSMSSYGESDADTIFNALPIPPSGMASDDVAVFSITR